MQRTFLGYYGPYRKNYNYIHEYIYIYEVIYERWIDINTYFLRNNKNINSYIINNILVIILRNIY